MSLGWLHLADLHQGLEGPRLWPTLREEFFADLGRLHDNSGPWQVVLFTGDLTYRGSEAEFDQLDDTLDKIWTRLAELGSTPGLLAVPGRHDLLRPNPLSPVHRALLAAAEQPQILAELWDNPDSEARAAIVEAFAPYQQWWTRRRHRLPRSWIVEEGSLPGDWAATIPVGERRVGVLGLNSSFVQLDAGDFEGRIHLDPRQFHAACGGDGPEWASRHDLCLLLTHHPASWLHPSALERLRSEIDVPPRFLAHLHARMGATQAYALTQGGSAPRRQWSAASLFGSEQELRHGYAAGRFEFGDEVSTLRTWPRSAIKTAAGIWRLGVDRDAEVDADGATRERLIHDRAPVQTPVTPPPAAPPPTTSPPATTAIAPVLVPPAAPARVAPWLLALGLGCFAAIAIVAIVKYSGTAPIEIGPKSEKIEAAPPIEPSLENCLTIAKSEGSSFQKELGLDTKAIESLQQTLKLKDSVTTKASDDPEIQADAIAACSQRYGHATPITVTVLDSQGATRPGVNVEVVGGYGVGTGCITREGGRCDVFVPSFLPPDAMLTFNVDFDDNAQTGSLERSFADVQKKATIIELSKVRETCLVRLVDEAKHPITNATIKVVFAVEGIEGSPFDALEDLDDKGTFKFDCLGHANISSATFSVHQSDPVRTLDCKVNAVSSITPLKFPCSGTRIPPPPGLCDTNTKTAIAAVIHKLDPQCEKGTLVKVSVRNHIITAPAYLKKWKLGQKAMKECKDEVVCPP